MCILWHNENNMMAMEMMINLDDEFIFEMNKHNVPSDDKDKYLLLDEHWNMIKEYAGIYNYKINWDYLNNFIYKNISTKEIKEFYNKYTKVFNMKRKKLSRKKGLEIKYTIFKHIIGSIKTIPQYRRLNNFINFIKYYGILSFDVPIFYYMEVEDTIKIGDEVMATVEQYFELDTTNINEYPSFICGIIVEKLDDGFVKVKAYNIKPVTINKNDYEDEDSRYFIHVDVEWDKNNFIGEFITPVAFNENLCHIDSRLSFEHAVLTLDNGHEYSLVNDGIYKCYKDSIQLLNF